ncbi:uncharacterized protein LOC108905467 isoform X2 [Anoplophora glabripennis]|uniref:uncharacterized protein LOC108905467 isoform X2 n=1 Tax=Anoplophora glabripennis TaxID=217634 RepID=UPI000873BD62|nr:uncharacterized protein LOC108905467 isoform X2 [Anoplophora glabripennis]
MSWLAGDPRSMNQDFSAEQFVENLLNEGSKVPCDETSDAFNNNLKLPPYYDEQLFKKGQEFFYRNIFGLFLSKFLGLIALLTLPSSVNILVMTNMSSTEMSAYKRYMATIFHMCLWYDEKFRPGSRSWDSIGTVRGLHNSASKRSCACLKYRITQKDMALTQFGFMGFGLVRSRMMGVHCASEEELKGFIHLWRTVGHVLGIEERFNICRESVAETKEICNLLIEKVFRPRLKSPSKHFKKMSSALINGLWTMNPILEFKVFTLYLQMALEDNSNVHSQPGFNLLTWQKKFKLYFILYTLWSLQFNVLRITHNYIQIIALWLMKCFPFLAYYKYGKANSLVKVK